tara:strand:+ start:37853 stop:38092 length:240 start_codon:yes stop_codon:yes gene_type:complete
MTLEEYLAAPGAMNLTELSEAVQVSKGRLSQLRAKDGEAPDFPPELAMKLERVTGGMIDASAVSSIVKDARAPRERNAA